MIEGWQNEPKINNRAGPGVRLPERQVANGFALDGSTILSQKKATFAH